MARHGMLTCTVRYAGCTLPGSFPWAVLAPAQPGGLLSLHQLGQKGRVKCSESVAGLALGTKG